MSRRLCITRATAPTSSVRWATPPCGAGGGGGEIRMLMCSSFPPPSHPAGADHTPAPTRPAPDAPACALWDSRPPARVRKSGAAATCSVKSGLRWPLACMYQRHIRYVTHTQTRAHAHTPTPTHTHTNYIECTPARAHTHTHTHTHTHYIARTPPHPHTPPTHTPTHTQYIKWGGRGCIASGLRDVTSHDLPPRVDVCYLCACRWVGTCRCACVGPGQAPK